MSPEIKKNIISALKQVGLLFAASLFLMTVARLGFFFYNFSNFKEEGIFPVLKALGIGIQFDLMVIYYSLIPILFLASLMNWILSSKVPQTVLLTIWSFSILALSVIDTAFFTYSKTKLGGEIFEMLEGDNNISIWTYISDYFWLFVIAISVWIFYVWRANRTNTVMNKGYWSLLSVLILIVVLFLPVRGTKLRPWRSTDAGIYVNSKLIPLALNSPLLVLEHTQNPTAFPELPPFESKVNRSPSQNYFKESDTPSPTNVVVIILESFGIEYTAQNGIGFPSYTPFLDSLARQSVVCTDAYANSLKSITALPAIYSSLPQLTDHNILSTELGHNDLGTLTKRLKALGYTNLFFHGADQSSMGFRPYLKKYALDRYYGKQDYDGPSKDFDGKWGIYDHAFFKFALREIGQTPEPFSCGIFSLSSHHPYSIPEEYENTFPNGDLAIHESIGYADHSLRLFFQEASKQAWFENTVFVLTADHSSENSSKLYQTMSGKYRIPLMFYAPKFLSPSTISHTVEQIDIYPTVLDLLNFQTEVWTMGESVFHADSMSGSLHYDNFTYHLKSGRWELRANQDGIVRMYDHEKDPLCAKDIKKAHPEVFARLSREMRFQAQEYQERLSSNTFN